MVKRKYLKQYAYDARIKLEQYTDWFWLGILVVIGSLMAWEGVFFFRERPLVSVVVLLASVVVYGKIRRYQRIVNDNKIRAHLQKELFIEKLNHQPEILYEAYGYRIDAVNRLLHNLPQDSSRACKFFAMEDAHLVSLQQVREAVIKENREILVSNTDFSQKARDFSKEQQGKDILLLAREDIFLWAKWAGELADDEEIEQYLLQHTARKNCVKPVQKTAMIFLWGTFLFLLSLMLKPFALYYSAALLFYSMGYYQYLNLVFTKRSS